MEEKKKPKFQVLEYNISNTSGSLMITITFVPLDANQTMKDLDDFIEQVARQGAQQDLMEIADMIKQGCVQSKEQKRSRHCWRTITAWLGSETCSYVVSVLAIMSLVISIMK